MSSQKIAVIAGVGSGTGSAVARRFGKEYIVCLLARKPESYEPVEREINASGGKALGISTDVSKPESVKAAFAQIEQTFPNIPVQAAVFNAAGGFVRRPLLDITLEQMDGGLNVSVKGALLFAQSALPLLVKHTESNPETPPSLFFTGSTAAVKANPGSAIMCVPRHGLRALAISAAKEFGPKGVHVVHTVVDGAIDTPWGKEIHKDKTTVDPEAIAQTYWDLHLQSRRCFTNEIDIRPMMEKW
ncbi:Putative NAD(P)-binding domain superfamily [Septoria linicola]|uniref:NAD(P)-binding domain superfamily n=1 Tax=Septoria linicola TaxID=215465 RepID=A0A9Q9AS74_9PEZI|nr:Putative NAD(P)-binding domain superfamily [Septoria linicola]